MRYMREMTTSNSKNSIKIIEGGITTPKGFRAAGIHSGIKKTNTTKKDIAIIHSETPAECSAVFTKHTVKSPVILWCQNVLKQKAKISAVVANSGNANAFTGERGYKDAETMANTFAQCAGIDKTAVLVASTGVTGVFLPIDIIVEGIKNASKNLTSDSNANKDAAEAILTTDTFAKEICVELNLGGKSVKIAGMAKGSGMIHPNMATTLAFITTDANISAEMLDSAFKDCIDDSFNMISVDGQTSPSDTVLVLANGKAENPIINKEGQDYDEFKNALGFVCKQLAKLVIKDGEGMTKFIEVSVSNAKSKADAKILCMAVITSNLVKAAMFGNDANWGRVLSAMGATNIDFDQNKTEIVYKSAKGEIKLFENGAPIAFSEDKALEIIREKEIQVLIDMKNGNASVTGWGCDLTYDYVKINADYRT